MTVAATVTATAPGAITTIGTAIVVRSVQGNASAAANFNVGSADREDDRGDDRRAAREDDREDDRRAARDDADE